MEIRRADMIADELEELVFAGEYGDGDRLDEVKLAAHFGVSRTPLREAFQRLVASGLAEQIPRRGVFVRQPGPVELMEMFETMAEIEGVCGRLAAMRMSDAAIEVLAKANTRCQQAIEASDIDGYYRENEVFHHFIYQQSGNSFLEQEALRLHRRLKPFRRHQLKFRGRMAQSMSEHVAIVAALKQGDPDRAAEALRGHVAIQGEKFHMLMSSLKTAAQ
ncbi:GntR family transcriptional regulator [Parasedimentitalea psychrophila]|uniref:GntR family transcriptional regulator n=1 Tax=Parasedimentitalea psychrophila TaxID=2997337 RepID=A0A9Y2KWA8_9RHOB|nr:GntR family transcriptional regulator [Parasedimentitalea psychrophila]WIY23863.1 GntR family transcriptional regulator [Parasedimentitalea psychrophila]